MLASRLISALLLLLSAQALALPTGDVVAVRELRALDTASVVNVIERSITVDTTKRTSDNNMEALDLAQRASASLDVDASVAPVARTLEAQDDAGEEAAEDTTLSKRSYLVSCFLSCMDDYRACGMMPQMHIVVAPGQPPPPKPRNKQIKVTLSGWQIMKWKTCQKDKRQPNCGALAKQLKAMGVAFNQPFSILGKHR